MPTFFRLRAWLLLSVAFVVTLAGCNSADVFLTPKPTRIPCPPVIVSASDFNFPSSTVAGLVLPDITPVPPPSCVSEAITLENSSRLTLLARLGKEPAQQAILSPNGLVLAVVLSQTIDLYDTGTWGQYLRIDSPSPIASAVIEPNSETIFVGSADGKVRRYALTTGYLWFVCDGFDSNHPIDKVAISANGQYVAAWTKQTRWSGVKLKYWKAATGRLLGPLKQFDAWQPSEIHLLDGRRVVAELLPGEIRISEIGSTPNNKRTLHSVTGYSGPISNLSFSADNRRLVVEPTGGGFTVWDWANNVAVGAYAEYQSPYFGKDGSLIGVSGLPHLSVRNLDTGAELQSIPQLAATNCLISPDRQWLAVWQDADLVLWNLPQATPVWNLASMQSASPYSTNIILTVAFSSDSKTLALTHQTVLKSGYRTPASGFSLWEVATGRLIVGHSEFVGLPPEVSFSPDGTMLIVSNSTLWNLTNGRAYYVQIGQALHTTFLPAGQPVIAESAQEGSVWLSDLLGTIHAHQPYNQLIESGKFAFSPDGRLLAFGAPDGTVRVWGLRSP